MVAETRCFFALWPSPVVAGWLFAQGAPVDGRRMRQETLHLTLAFLGNVPTVRIPELLRVAGELALPVADLEMDCLGYWARQHLCWVGPTQLPASFHAFVGDLHTALRANGFALEEREFAAHVTLLRNVREAPKVHPLEPPLRWCVESWRLVGSLPDGNGRRYESLGEWPACPGRRS